jgi:hypothetical protein
MTAATTTGRGHGSSNKFTTKELAKIANGPVIMVAGYAESQGGVASPPSSSDVVVFPTPLEGGSENYVVLLTTQNGGYAYVNNLNENADGDFIGFSFLTETDCSLMYLVAKVGHKPATI